MRVLRLWHDVQQDNTWSSGGYGSPPLLIGINVVDRDRDGQLSFVQAVFTERILLQLHTAEALPALRVDMAT